MTDSENLRQPLMKRPLKAGQAPLVGLTPPLEKSTVQPISQSAHESFGEGVSESGGPQGAEPTRYGDWERRGRCSDF